MSLRSILQALIVRWRRSWEGVRNLFGEDERPLAVAGWNGQACRIDRAHAKVHDLPPAAPHDVHVTIVRNMQNAIVQPGESFPLFETYVDVDFRLSDERTKRKLVRRKLKAKIALERGPTAFDELVIMLAVMFATPKKRTERLNGIRIQLYEYVERYGLAYGRWFFLRDVAKETKAIQRIKGAGRLLKITLRSFGLLP
jgi:hypothetical protein